MTLKLLIQEDCGRCAGTGTGDHGALCGECSGEKTQEVWWDVAEVLAMAALWPIPGLRKEPMGDEMREALAFDQRVAESGECATCGLTGGLFDYHYTKEPYRYRAFARCPAGHVTEF